MSAEDPRLPLLRRRVREVPDFPKPGILFRDLTPLMGDGMAMRACISLLTERVAAHKPDVIVAVESRGFIFGGALAARLNASFVPVRKPGKLPARVDRVAYSLEYGKGELEMHRDALRSGARTVIVDDLLATGGTAAASGELVRRQGGNLVAFAFVIELEALAGRLRLSPVPVVSLIQYA